MGLSVEYLSGRREYPNQAEFTLSQWAVLLDVSIESIANIVELKLVQSDQLQLGGITFRFIPVSCLPSLIKQLKRSDPKWSLNPPYRLSFSS